MFAAEAQREDNIDAVTIATPNNTHFEITKAALEHGLHVVLEKPLTFTMAKAEALEKLARDRDRVVSVAYGYSGHQMIEQARQMVAVGRLGKIRLVNLQFAHGFHSAPVERDNPGTAWRINPEPSGPSYVLGDVGTHPFYLSEVICPDLKIKRLMCAPKLRREPRAARRQRDDADRIRKRRLWNGLVLGGERGCDAQPEDPDRGRACVD